MRRFIITGGLLALLLVGCATGSPSPTPQPTEAIAEATTEATAEATEAALAGPTADPEFIAPDFIATSLDGTTYQLSDLRGQWVILNFWATWCGPCVHEMPALQAIADNYADQIVLLGLNVAEDEALVRAFVAEHEIRFPILIDVSDTTHIDYMVMGLPQTVIIAPNGELMWRQFGPVELDTFSGTLDDFIANWA